jgi:hypothetical protein
MWPRGPCMGRALRSTGSRTLAVDATNVCEFDAAGSAAGAQLPSRDVGSMARDWNRMIPTMSMHDGNDSFTDGACAVVLFTPACCLPDTTDLNGDLLC